MKDKNQLMLTTFAQLLNGEYRPQWGQNCIVVGEEPEEKAEQLRLEERERREALLAFALPVACGKHHSACSHCDAYPCPSLVKH